MTILDINEIKALLPHRYPFLLVDRVIETKDDTYIKALKNVTANEPFFNGHFPTKPVMPGVLIVEALAQTAAVLAYKNTTAEERGIFYLAAIENARFKRVVEPGDQLILEVEKIRQKAGVWKFKGKAMVDGEVAAIAEMTSMEG